MISLIELILKEAKQVGTLYHFTNYFNAVDIVDDDFKLNAKNSLHEPPEGVKEAWISFTRNKNFKSGTVTTSQVRFVIDGNKLSTKYKIVPYADYYMDFGRNKEGGDENEERINSANYNDVVELKNALIQVDVVKLESSNSYKLLIEDLEKSGVKYNILDKF